MRTRFPDQETSMGYGATRGFARRASTTASTDRLASVSAEARGLGAGSRRGRRDVDRSINDGLGAGFGVVGDCALVETSGKNGDRTSREFRTIRREGDMANPSVEVSGGQAGKPTEGAIPLVLSLRRSTKERQGPPQETRKADRVVETRSAF
jgi:hypothetical protein